MSPSKFLNWWLIACVVGLLLSIVANVFTGGMMPIIGGALPGLFVVGIGYGMTTRVLVAALERGRALRAMWAAIACGALSFVLWLGVIVYTAPTGAEPATSVSLAGLLATTLHLAGCVAAIVIIPRARSRGLVGLRLAGLGAGLGALLALFILVANLIVRDGVGVEETTDLLARLAGVCGIAWAGCAIALWIVDRFNVAVDAEVDRFACRLTCPRCGHRGELASGGDWCRGCGLVVKMEAT